MAESSSFSSLMALAENHLSKTNLKTMSSETGGSTPVPSNIRLSLPNLNNSKSSISIVLAEQVSNMLKARELKKQEGDKRLVEKTAKLKLTEDPDSCEIDLMQALQQPLGPPSSILNDDVISSCDSEESFLEFLQENVEPEKKSREPLLPCVNDMAFILKVKVCRGKPSFCGKVLTSRIKNVAAPYLRENIYNPKISQFKFTTPSPCDIIKSKLAISFSYSDR